MAKSKQSGRSTAESTKSSSAGDSGFVKTGKARNKQFEVGTAGQKERGFTQWTEKAATAAMQGTGMTAGEGGSSRWIKPARSDASRQFSTPKGKKPF